VHLYELLLLLCDILNSVSYTIANLDLSGFKLKAEDVELEMPTLDALEAAVCTPLQQQSKSTLTSEQIALAAPAAAAAAAAASSASSSSRFRRRSSGVRRRSSANVSTYIYSQSLLCVYNTAVASICVLQ
jgi:hypothetical protein